MFISNTHWINAVFTIPRNFSDIEKFIKHIFLWMSLYISTWTKGRRLCSQNRSYIRSAASQYGWTIKDWPITGNGLHDHTDILTWCDHMLRGRWQLQVNFCLLWSTWQITDKLKYWSIGCVYVRTCSQSTYVSHTPSGGLTLLIILT